MYLYDLTRAPPWFNFMTFLAACATDAQGPFDLSILRGVRNDGLDIDIQTRVGFVHTVMMPATRLYPVKELRLFPHEVPDGKSIGFMERDLFQFDENKDYKPIPSLKVPEWALRAVRKQYPENTVTISLREARHNPHRNSDIDVWKRVATSLTAQGYHVVFLRDTEAYEEIGRASDWAASNNLILRAALYEHAVMNTGSMHGCTTLCWFNARANYVLFDKCPPTKGLDNDWMRHAGHDPDADREAWGLPGQRCLWERATVERVLDEFAATPQEKNAQEFFTIEDRPDLRTNRISVSLEDPSIKKCVDRFLKHPHDYVESGELHIPAGFLPVGEIKECRGKITPESEGVYTFERCNSGIPTDAKFVYFRDGIKPEVPWVNTILNSQGRKADFIVNANTPGDTMDKNVRINGKRDLPWFQGIPPHKESAVLVGGGPSLMENLKHIRSRQKRGQKIFAFNGVHDYLLENGIKPDYHVMMDARPDNVGFVQKPQKGTKYLMCSRCHPSVFDALEGYDVTLWHAYVDHMDTWLAREFPDHVEPYLIVGGGPTVGSRTLYLAKQMGFFKMHLYGFDCSYRGDENHAYKQDLNANEAVQEVFVGERSFKTAPWMVKQLHFLVEQMNVLMNGNPPVEMTVHGSGLFPYYISRTMEKAA